MAEYIKVDLIHNLHKNKVWKEIKFNKYETIENVKKKIYSHTGTPCDGMKLYAYDDLNIKQTQMFLGDNNLCLNDYNVRDNYIIYVYETGPHLDKEIYNIDNEQILEQLKDRKYKISEEAYENRQDSMRNFLKKLREQKKKEKHKEEGGAGGESGEGRAGGKNLGLDISDGTSTHFDNINMYDKELYKIGNRCRVIIGDRRGVLKFIGNLKNNNEIYVGLDLDEPLGNSDGFYKNQFLFECKGDRYGYLGLINSIEMGGFPPIDILNMEEF